MRNVCGNKFIHPKIKKGIELPCFSTKDDFSFHKVLNLISEGNFTFDKNGFKDSISIKFSSYL